MVGAEYQNRSEIMYWLTTPRMVPQVHSLDCMTDGDRHSLDEPHMEAQMPGEMPCMVWGCGVCKHTVETENGILVSTTKLHIYF